MGKQRLIQSKNNELIAMKVKVIYELLCRENIMELVELLSNQTRLAKEPQYRNNRKKALSTILRKKSAGMVQLKKVYHSFKLAQLYMNDMPVFDESFFFESDLSQFRQRVEAYEEYLQMQSLDIDLSYRYIYLFDHSKKEKDNHNVNNLSYYEVEYAEIHNLTLKNGLEIIVYPPPNKLDCGQYKGTIKKRNNQIILMFENRYDSVHMIFNASLVASSPNPLFHESYYGLAIGINDLNHQTPVSRKVVFSKKKFTPSEQEQLYLILNETKALEAKENIYALEQNNKLDADHIGKYEQKIKDIHTFFSKVKYSEAIETNIMHHMVFTEFHVFQKMFEKFARKQDYFLRDRKRVCLEFIRFLQSHLDKKVRMVLPLYSKRENIFLFETAGKKSLKTLFIELANKGINMEIIFVVEKPADYHNTEIIEIFSQLDAAGIKLYFSGKGDVEKFVNSYDFCYMLGGVDAIFKSNRHTKEMFTITQNKEQIKTLMMDFQRIIKCSYTYKQMQNGDCIIGVEDNVLKKLIGKWYLYFYGSFTYRDGVPVFWEVAIEVKSDYSVIENAQDAKVQSGKVEVFSNQTLFTLISAETQNSFYMVMNNNKISEVTSVMIYSKQDQKDLDMAMIGIASRERLMNEEAQILLGDPQKAILKVEPILQIKIDEFILAHKVSSMIPLK